MKILLIHENTNKRDDFSAVHLWRIIRPFAELAKHVDWQIDHQPHLINTGKLDSKDQLTNEELERQAKRLGSYDIIWSSYYTDTMMFALAQVVARKYGTKFVIDDDDDIYNIADDNPFWRKMTKENQWAMQRMIEEAPYIVTTNERLQKFYQTKSFVNSMIRVLPNFISSDYKPRQFENSPNILISFFGGAAHKHDLAKTGVMPALERIMHNYKNVHVKFIGCEAPSYLPTGRFTFEYGKMGYAWTDDVWPSIQADICLGPLEDTQFNRSKSPIKWMESAVMPAAFVGSNVYPFKGFVKNGETGLLVNNTADDWYEAIASLIKNRTLRKKIATNAQEAVKAYTIEKNWPKLKKLIEEIAADTEVRHDWEEIK